MGGLNDHSRGAPHEDPLDRTRARDACVHAVRPVFRSRQPHLPAHSGRRRRAGPGHGHGGHDRERRGPAAHGHRGHRRLAQRRPLRPGEQGVEALRLLLHLRALSHHRPPVCHPALRSHLVLHCAAAVRRPRDAAPSTVLTRVLPSCAVLLAQAHQTHGRAGQVPQPVLPGTAGHHSRDGTRQPHPGRLERPRLGCLCRRGVLRRLPAGL